MALQEADNIITQTIEQARTALLRKGQYTIEMDASRFGQFARAALSSIKEVKNPGLVVCKIAGGEQGAGRARAILQISGLEAQKAVFRIKLKEAEIVVTNAVGPHIKEGEERLCVSSVKTNPPTIMRKNVAETLEGMIGGEKINDALARLFADKLKEGPRPVDFSEFKHGLSITPQNTLRVQIARGD